jgi:trehalose 6-phosphate phosphatase
MAQKPDLSRFPALLFDLDGVITRTATIHAAAWKRLFDEFLAAYGEEHGRTCEAFEIATDYKRYIDGRRRYDGVDGFLRSRGVELPWGDPSDPPDAPTVCGLGNRKNQYFAEELEHRPVEVFDDAVELIRAERDRGAKIAVVSASENCRTILRNVGLLELFDVQMTGVEASELGLPGKPAPDTFLKAAEWLDAPPQDAVVFEDAISGVQAGRAGGFGLVVGVDRGGDEEGLAGNGADVVCTNLASLRSGAEPRA